MEPITIISSSEGNKSVVNSIKMVLDSNKVSYRLHQISAEDAPQKLHPIIEETKDTKIYICVSNFSAALPGIITSTVKQPVIAVPVSTVHDGTEELKSITQMPHGLPVASVGVDDGENAAHLAIRILNIGH